MVYRQVAEGQSGLPVPNSTKSYWHTQPSEKLTAYRSTPDLPSTVDTIIIGTGMTGAFAARFLKEQEPDASLLVLEAREACWGATGRNGGHCQPFLYATSEEVARFELETYFFLRDLCAKENIPCDFRSVAGVHALLDDEVWEAAKESIPRLRAKISDFADKIVLVGPEGLVTDSGDAPDWAAGMTLPSLRLNEPGVKGAVVQRYAASMWPYKLVCWVLEQLVSAHGAETFNLQTNTAVTGVARDPASGEWVVQTAGGRGAVTARRVLLATNAYTSRLLPAFADLIVPVRGQIGALLPPTEPRVGLEYSYVFFGQLRGEDGEPTTRDEYLVQRPLPGGELIQGGGRQAAKGMAVGEWRDDVVEEPVASWLRDTLEPVLDLGRKGEKEVESGLKARMEWTGIMGYSRDHAPWIGPVPEALGGGEGLFMACGFTGHGMPRCALAGRGVARMMTGNAEGHGLPKAFVASEERALKAREDWGRVGSVDEMETLLADFRESKMRL